MSQIKKFKVIDLFCGCGGMSLGFRNAGFEIVAAFDNWKNALDVYKKNFHHENIEEMDLSQILHNSKFFKLLNPDFVIGGPPCQDFSSAGKRDENLGRGCLTISYAEIIAEVKPKWFVMENVERIIKTDKLKKAKEILKKAGYGITITILDASLCGVPQKRKRFFMIGELNGEDDALLPYFEKKLSTTPLTLRQYFGDSLKIDYYYRHPRSYHRRGIFSVDEPSPTVRGVNRPIPSTYKKHPGDSSDIGPDVRPLTTLERSYIQTFPKDFIQCKSGTGKCF